MTRGLAILTPFRTRFARRVLAMFVLVALVPITVMAVVAYQQVTRQLDQQARERLRQASKSVGFAVVERLQFLEQDLRGVISEYRRTQDMSSSAEALDARFPALALMSPTGQMVILAGASFVPPSLTPAAARHLADGGTVLAIGEASGPEGTRLFMARLRDERTAWVVWAELNAPLVWLGRAAQASVPTNADLCVLGPGQVALFCTSPNAAMALPVAATRGGGQESVFPWRAPDGTDGVAARWVMFLRFEFAAPDWTVILSESRATALAPLQDFRRVFPLLLLLTMWVVLLLSNMQIRRNLRPLRALQDQTAHVAEGNFTARVEVHSGDEFEDLAWSFNAMTERLGRQFTALSAQHDVDRVVLTAPGVAAVAQAVAASAQAVLRRDDVGVLVLRAGEEGGAPTLDAYGPAGARPGAGMPLLQRLSEARGDGEIDLRGPEVEALTAVIWPAGGDRVLAYVIRREGVLHASLILGCAKGVEPGEADRQAARALADQLAVAMANAQLIDELDALSWGSVRALARAIDAKSRWTAGHSERVTRLATRLGEARGLDAPTMLTLHRGALLHDVGKIGVPSELLNKPGKLLPGEMELMRSHTTVGADILRPITAYAGIISIVRNHHERWDGGGYPDRLQGEDIPPLARLLAVPDVFDALTSERPYRGPWTVQDAMAYIVGNSGAAFDPAVVTSFAAMHAAEPLTMAGAS